MLILKTTTLLTPTSGSFGVPIDSYYVKSYAMNVAVAYLVYLNNFKRILATSLVLMYYLRICEYIYSIIVTHEFPGRMQLLA